MDTNRVVEAQERLMPALGLDDFVAEHGDWLVRCAYLLTRDRERALDLAQDTLVRVWRSWDRVAAADHPDRYVLRVMLNQQRSLTSRRRVREVPLTEASGVAANGDPLAAIDDLAGVGAALDLLSPRQRAVPVLRYWLDLDDVAIAAELGCRRSTVRSLAARGLAVVREHLVEED